MIDFTTPVAALEHIPRVLIDNLDQGVFVLGLDGQSLLINRRLAQWLGRHAVDLVGRPIEELFPDRADRYRATLQRVLLGEQRPEREDLTLLGDEVRVWHVQQMPVRDLRGRVVGLLGLCRDVTEDRQCEEELRLARRLATLEKSAVGLAHDLRNLLTVVRGHLDLLAPLGTAEVQQELGPLIQATERAMTLSGRFLASARQQVLPREPVEVHRVLTETAAMIRPLLRPGIALEVRGRPSLPAVLGDACQLIRLLLNLSLNALRAVTGGGHLLLETDVLRLDPEHMQAHPHGRPGRFVCLTVADSGSGIPSGVQSRLFDLFQRGRRDGEGFGIGLNVVASIVQQHDGWLEYESSPDTGTCFQVFLPAIEPASF